MSVDESVERLSVAAAAEALGVTRDAIHKRISRGSIEFEKGDDGRFYVYVASSTSGLDSSTDTSYVTGSKVEAAALVSRLEDEVRFLREELARKDAILLRMAESIPQLEAPRESPVSEASPRPSPTPPSGGPQEGAERPDGRRSWWRRVFLGGRDDRVPR